MENYCIWFVVCTLVQLSLVYLWFDSEILSRPFAWCLKQKRNSTNNFTWFVFTLLTCSNCLGYWFSWIVVAAGSYLPGSPLSQASLSYSIFVIFFTGLGVTILSRIIDGFMPEPISTRIFVDIDDEEEDTDTVEETVDIENKENK